MDRISLAHVILRHMMTVYNLDGQDGDELEKRCGWAYLDSHLYDT